VEGLVTAVTDQQLFGGTYAGRRVFVTGHTGFKGSWLVYWLLSLGADVTGYSLEPPTDPSLFEELRLEERMDSRIADVRDLAALRSVMLAAQPEIVFHLAAQPLVRLSYDEPVETFETNVMGSVNVLEAARGCKSVRAIVNVTSDKCYENREWEFAYRENDAMGGFDPYSASKGAAEIVTAAYRQSFFADADGAAVATGRAGNVIGGGDWALDRIVPDCVRALSAGGAIPVRNPDAIRPWQHVLEPVSAYLWLASRIYTEGHAFEGSWNFGPLSGGNLNVAAVVDAIVAEWGSGRWVGPEPGSHGVHEARFLKLDCAKAVDVLEWRPVWDAAEALVQTTRWYRDRNTGVATPEELTAECLRAYVAGARAARIAWTEAAR
jgi:CDP-glucose 4,6-dehydratase